MSRTESIVASPVGAAYPSAEPLPLDADFDARWAAWLARGVAHERAARRKLLMGVPLLAVAAAIVYALLGQ